jgi:hypothetical protein
VWHGGTLWENEFALWTIWNFEFDCVTAAPTVEPPPFEPQRGSYSPGTTGVALYFTDTGERGRYTPRFPSRLTEWDGKVGLSMYLWSYFHCLTPALLRDHIHRFAQKNIPLRRGLRVKRVAYFLSSVFMGFRTGRW